MRKSAIVLALLLSASPAAAGPYTGIDYQYAFVDYRAFSNQPQHFGGWGAHLGWRFHHIALEAGYSRAWGKQVSLSGEHLDVLGFLKDEQEAGVQPFLSAGVARMSARSSITSGPFNDTKYSWEIGAGLQWKALRAGLNYEQLGTKGMDYAIIFRLGVQIGR